MGAGVSLRLPPSIPSGCVALRARAARLGPRAGLPRTCGRPAGPACARRHYLGRVPPPAFDAQPGVRARRASPASARSPARAVRPPPGPGSAPFASVAGGRPPALPGLVSRCRPACALAGDGRVPLHKPFAIAEAIAKDLPSAQLREFRPRNAGEELHRSAGGGPYDDFPRLLRHAPHSPSGYADRVRRRSRRFHIALTDFGERPTWAPKCCFVPRL
jgi:hypothetical protein